MPPPQSRGSNSDFEPGFLGDPHNFGRTPCSSAASVILDEGAPLLAYDEYRPETPPPSYEEVVQGGFLEKKPGYNWAELTVKKKKRSEIKFVSSSIRNSRSLLFVIPQIGKPMC